MRKTLVGIGILVGWTLSAAEPPKVQAGVIAACTLTPAEIAHRSASIGHLCYASIKAGHRLAWDPATERIVNDPAAERFLSRPLREPWHV